MNKYKLTEFLHKDLGNYTCTLKEASYDSQNNQYLCKNESLENVYNFDKYVKDKHSKDSLLASPDAIYIGNQHLYCIEFKNQLYSKIDKEKIKTKFASGTGILKDLLKDFKARDCKYFFCLAYKPALKNRYAPANHIESTSIKYSLEKLNKDFSSFYSKIYTKDIDFYKTAFKDLLC